MPHFDKNVELLQRRYHVFSDLSVVSSSAVGHCHGNITVEASKRRRHASQTPNDWMTRITHWERRRRRHHEIANMMPVLTDRREVNSHGVLRFC